MITLSGQALIDAAREAGYDIKYHSGYYKRIADTNLALPEDARLLRVGESRVGSHYISLYGFSPAVAIPTDIDNKPNLLSHHVIHYMPASGSSFPWVLGVVALVAACSLRRRPTR